jgi:hypothetical protein
MKMFFQILLLLIITGCTQTALQVVDLGCTDCSGNKEYFMTESDKLRIEYYFWNQNGIMGLVIKNKTARPIYIDWKKCSFIVGDLKNDYWSESFIMTSSALSESRYNQTTKRMEMKSQEYAIVTTKPERITFIPPKAMIIVGHFELRNRGISVKTKVYVKKHNMVFTVKEKISNTTYIKPEDFQYWTAEFSSTDSPFLFRSFITYMLEENSTKEYYIDNQFYAKKVWEIPKSPSEIEGNSVITYDTLGIQWSSPKSFFIITIEGTLRGRE